MKDSERHQTLTKVMLLVRGLTGKKIGSPQATQLSKFANVGEFSYGIEYAEIRQWVDGVHLTIGKFVSMATGVKFIIGGDHNLDWASTYPFAYDFDGLEVIRGDRIGHPKKPKGIKVGNDVWIGTNATIMDGVEIGDGAVVAANSHVVKSVPSYAIVGGNPASLLRYRFQKEIIESLQEMKWWNWEIECIAKAADLLCSPLTLDSLKQIRELRTQYLSKSMD